MGELLRTWWWAPMDWVFRWTHLHATLAFTCMFSNALMPLCTAAHTVRQINFKVQIYLAMLPK
ncbi:hypothetical protein ASD75_08750 [Acidovorax sp. Root568]|nr:hypothetical protein ASC83_09435 [Acidovorax sp. Root402]KRA09549.1 hypothetical protein ASD75_08750 [Acidovorax sp. Root568]